MDSELKSVGPLFLQKFRIVILFSMKPRFFTTGMPKVGGKVPTRTYGQIVELELLEDLKKIHKPKKQFAYQIDVSWTDSSTRRVYRYLF